MTETIARDFLLDMFPHRTAFGDLVSWRVDDLAGDGDATGIASDVETARLEAVTHIKIARLKP